MRPHVTTSNHQAAAFSWTFLIYGFMLIVCHLSSSGTRLFEASPSQSTQSTEYYSGTTPCGGVGHSLADKGSHYPLIKNISYLENFQGNSCSDLDIILLYSIMCQEITLGKSIISM